MPLLHRDVDDATGHVHAEAVVVGADAEPEVAGYLTIELDLVRLAVDIGIKPSHAPAHEDHLAGLERGEAGLAPLRMYVEAHAALQLFQDLQRRIASTKVRAAQDAVRRGTDRGEQTRSDVDVELVASLAGGGMIDHVLTTPPNRRERSRAKRDAYAGALGDLVLSGLISQR